MEANANANANTEAVYQTDTGTQAVTHGADLDSNIVAVEDNINTGTGNLETSIHTGLQGNTQATSTMIQALTDDSNAFSNLATSGTLTWEDAFEVLTKVIVPPMLQQSTIEGLEESVRSVPS